MKLIFVSNYLNHHQIPFCDSLYEKLKGDFAFVQTEPMEQERIDMGWDSNIQKPYLKFFYKTPKECRDLILDSEMVLFGGTDDESYITDRLQASKPVIRYSERLYKTGQWKAVSPRGLKKKYHDHTRYRNSDVYLLCSGGYVASDFGIIRSYPGKMFCWGYFPETIHYDVDHLFKNKEMDPVSILWAGRFIDWKHPELAVETAEYLKSQDVSFHLDIIGGGELKEYIETLIREKHLENFVTLRGFLPPPEVRSFMERANILLFTSDRQEGWGAVANEAMNSGCAVVADHMIGAVPYLIQNGKNGLIYKDGDKKMLFEHTCRLAQDPSLCRKLGENAYRTIVTEWNAENAAEKLIEMIDEIKTGTLKPHSRRTKKPYPGAPEMPVFERKMYRILLKTSS